MRAFAAVQADANIALTPTAAACIQQSLNSVRLILILSERRQLVA